MKILFIAREFPPFDIYGGAGRHLGYLIGNLLNYQNVTPTVICEGEGKEELDIGCEVIPIQHDFSSIDKDDAKESLALCLEWAWKVVKGAGVFDIIHCHTWYSLLPGLLLKQVTEAPLVVTCHSLDIDRPWKRDSIGALYGFTTWLEKSACLEADAVITVSDCMAKSIHDMCGNLASVEVIGNGVDHLTSVSPSRPNRLCGLQAESGFVLFVGRLTEQKGVELFLRAASLVKSDIQFVVCAGAADSRSDELRYLGVIRNLKESGRRIVLLEGIYDKKELAWLYTHASIYVSTSVYEPFGLTIAEALSCGVPCILPEEAGISGYLKANTEAILLPMSDKGGSFLERALSVAKYIDLILNNADVARNLSINGQMAFRRLPTWNEIAGLHVELYARLLGIK